jgi:hypothetical protein
MATIRFHTTANSSPEEFVAGLTDFGPGRAKLFAFSADNYLVVHDQGPTSADVTEGSHGIWERLRYDWSDPNRVVMTTTDSNIWGGRSGHTYTLTRHPGQKTEIDAVVVREGKNVAGRVFATLASIIGPFALRRQLDKSVRAIEARAGSPTVGPGESHAAP